MKVEVKRIAFMLVAMTMMLAYLGKGQGIQDMEVFKKELKDPYKSVVEYTVLGLRGLRMGYFSKYRHGNFSPELMKRDERCFGEVQEKSVYQIVYFMFKGELIDIETVLDDIELLYSDTINYCGVLETTKALY